MKKLTVFVNLILLAAILFNINILSAQIEPGALLIKLSPDAGVEREFSDNGNSTALRTILGNHSVKKFINPNLIENLKNKSKQNRTMAPMRQRWESISRMYKIKYDSGLDPRSAAAKLASHPDIEIAEPAPAHRIFESPNDPSLMFQYYLFTTHALDAADTLDTQDTVVIGIVDTGVDYEHPDLAANIYHNPGEMGTDAEGNDRRSNGIDDDDNGFVDDWRGWDFVSSEHPNGDNDPRPGNQHGTHVAGIAAAVRNNGIGIAGMAVKAEIMMVKIGQDHPLSKSVENSYDGVLYAASNGADVINCSWGSSAPSEIERNIIETATQLGSIVIAAAGNDSENQSFYPAAYPEVISVAAVNSEDRRAPFSNYNYSVDISAPGTGIYSTVPDSSYDLLNGTSMASPVVAGAAAMLRHKHPEYSPLELGEHLKATADDISEQNPAYYGLLGSGRVNVLSAVTAKSVRAVMLQDYIITNENNDEIIDIGERVEIMPTLMNVLDPLEGANIEIYCENFPKPRFIDSVFDLGGLAKGQVFSPSEPFSFIMPDDVPMNHEMKFRMIITAGDDFVDNEYFSVMTRPSYRTMRGNKITATFNSSGNIAYNDYPSNVQGDGFRYDGSANMLYEGSLMAGISPDRLSNVARSSFQMRQDDGFLTREIFRINQPGETSPTQGYAEFRDHADSISAGIGVIQRTFQFDEPSRQDFVIVAYDIYNVSGEFFDSLFVGLYFDWDIGPNGANNVADFDDSEIFGYIHNVSIEGLPWAGALQLSNHSLNYFAIDNNGTGATNPGVYDGFTRSEKWMMLSGGIGRKQSSITDASMAIGAGPIRLPAGDTVRVAFALFSGYSLAELRATAESARQTARKFDLGSGGYQPLPAQDTITALYPNPPSAGEIFIDFSISDNQLIWLEVFDVPGRRVGVIIGGEYRSPGIYTEKFNTSMLAPGRYYIRMRTLESTRTMPFNVVR